MRKVILNSLKIWIPLAVVITLLSGFLFSLQQQNIRTSANDPQIQMVEDAANALNAGKDPQTLVNAIPVDLSKSLSPYLIIFNDLGQPVASSAQLEGRTPVPPPGVFTYTKEHGEDRITWQPKPWIRSAAVIKRFDAGRGGFVLAGRSLREVESRTQNLLYLAAAGWGFSLLVTLILSLIITKINSRQPKL